MEGRRFFQLNYNAYLLLCGLADFSQESYRIFRLPHGPPPVLALGQHCWRKEGGFGGLQQASGIAGDARARLRGGFKPSKVTTSCLLPTSMTKHFVALWEIPSLVQRIDQTAEVNCGLQSEVTCSDTPNLDTNVATKLSTHDVAKMSLRRHCFQPPCRPVNHGEDVVESTRRNLKGSHQVHMHVGETAAGNRNWLHRGGWLRCDLGPATTLAFLTPSIDVREDVFPDKAGCDEVTINLRPWMGDVVNAVKNSMEVLHRNDGPDEAPRHITQEKILPQWYSMELESV